MQEIVSPPRTAFRPSAAQRGAQFLFEAHRNGAAAARQRPNHNAVGGVEFIDHAMGDVAEPTRDTVTMYRAAYGFRHH
jgi:hypothetical protein